jgi:hypothetical protein
MSRASLRIPTGWLVEWNTLTEPPEGRDRPPLDDLTEDLLLLSKDHPFWMLTIELGWRPEFKPRGHFYLTAARLENDQAAQVEAWHSPLRVKKSRSYSKIRATLEEWLEDETLAKSKAHDNAA